MSGRAECRGRIGGHVWHELFELAYRYLRARGASHTDAEDLAQETLIAAFEHLDGIPPGRLRAWVCIVARNKHIDAVRRGQHKHEFPGRVEGSDATRDPLWAVIRSDDRASVFRLLNALSPDDRQLLQLKYLEERSVEEIAEALGKPANTVKVKLFRARQRARKQAKGGGAS